MKSPNSRRPWAWPSELRAAGVLGINERNLEYVLRDNPRSAYPTVDDKLVTKEICATRGIPVPETYAVIRYQGELRNLAETLAEHEEFVVKPASGAAGRGILVVDRREADGYRLATGERIGHDDVRFHVSTILSGLHSLGGRSDRALVERRLRRATVFDPVVPCGTPDIRVVMYRRFPVLAMLRLPTIRSGGRANLHQGAIAVGIDVATGQTKGGVWRNRAVAVHPDTGNAVEGIQVPGWRDLLLAAVRLSDGLDLQYLGIDFVVDREMGPMVLEANARPGLAIQIANRRGLLPLLKRIQSLSGGLSEEERIAASTGFAVA